MNEELKKTTSQKLRGYFRSFFHYEASGVSSEDRYKSFRIRLILIVGALAGVPLITLMIISYFWLENLLEADYDNDLRWQIKNTQESIEYFLKEKFSGLNFLISLSSYDQLSDQKALNSIFVKCKTQFGELVDLGVIGSNGIQKSYAGPYHLEGKDYSNQDWFHEVVIRGVYVSEVFTGYRKIPHFAIAIRQEAPDKGTFWILRATIDTETLHNFVSTFNLEKDDDAFIINNVGILQTPSRFHGNVLDRFPLNFPLVKKGVSIIELTKAIGGQGILGYSYVNNSPWILAVMIKSRAHTTILKGFRNEMLIILSICIIIGIALNVWISTTVVNSIKGAEDKREEAIAESEHASKLASIGQLAAGVAHEINNPLAVINEKAGLMQDILEIADDNPNKEKFLAQIAAIIESVKRCRTITHRLLGFARRMDVSKEAVDLNDLIHEVLGFVEKEALYRNITLELYLKDDVPAVMSDKGQLQQVFLNIINNAMDAVGRGGSVSISTNAKNANTATVSVKDNGPGIPKEALKHIFEPFFTTKEKGKGTGLGLSISYGIVKRLGGAILVESEVDKGTTFTIEIPRNIESI